MAFTCGIANMWLPETNKRPLPDCVDNLLHPELDYDKELRVLECEQCDDDLSVDGIPDTAKMLQKD